MIGWSDWSESFVIPSGALDAYHSLQHLTAGACVAAHLHDGPENGLIVGGVVTRWDEYGERRLEMGSSFLTPAAVIHGTGNTTTVDAEQITLHVLPRGAPFARPCASASFPAAAPGASTRVRVCFALDDFGSRISTRHAIATVVHALPLPASDDRMLLTVLAGEVEIEDRPATTNEGRYIARRAATTLVRGCGAIVVTEIRLLGTAAAR
ncbi:MAG: hypothetical protein M3R53_07770 [Candidatus Eremiobacteraeota bacterium]|nr:hypothetical protein [Candidatus Eremiobacteraeota bacterium]